MYLTTTNSPRIQVYAVRGSCRYNKSSDSVSPGSRLRSRFIHHNGWRGEYGQWRCAWHPLVCEDGWRTAGDKGVAFGSTQERVYNAPYATGATWYTPLS